ncbi:MAG: ABC transporter permease [Candidatus Heimdallarchaeaceae archaeon]
MSKKKEDFYKLKNSRFSFRRTGAVAFRTLNQLRRDRRTLVLLFIVPIIIMLIFGLALSGEIKNVPIIVDNQDVLFTNAFPAISLDLGENITESLQNDDRVAMSTGDYTESLDLVEKGDYIAAIYIPENFSESVARMTLGEEVIVKIFIYIDSTKPIVKASVFGALQDALGDAMGEKGIVVDQEIAHGGVELSGLDVGIPAVIGYVLVFLLLLVGMITIVREKIQGTQDRLYATPLKPSERLLGYVVGLMVIALLMITLVLIFGVFIFGAKVQGNVFLLILGAFLFGIAHVFMAVFLSNFAENELQAMQFAPLTAIPSMALSGMLVPISSLPAWLQPVTYAVPLTYGINLFEGIMLKGWGFAELWLEFTVITGMALLFFILAVLTVRNRMKD